MFHEKPSYFEGTIDPDYVEQTSPWLAKDGSIHWYQGESVAIEFEIDGQIFVTDSRVWQSLPEFLADKEELLQEVFIVSGVEIKEAKERGYNEARQIHIEKIEKTIKDIPLGRFADPADDIGRVCVFLASKDASFVTGETITLQGGSGLRP